MSTKRVKHKPFIKELCDMFESDGFKVVEIEKTNGGHVRWTLEKSGATVSLLTALTASDRRAAMNNRAFARRAIQEKLNERAMDSAHRAQQK